MFPGVWEALMALKDRDEQAYLYWNDDLCAYCQYVGYDSSNIFGEWGSPEFELGIGKLLLQMGYPDILKQFSPSVYQTLTTKAKTEKEKRMAELVKLRNPNIDIKDIQKMYGEKITTYRLVYQQDFTEDDLSLGYFNEEVIANNSLKDEFCEHFAEIYGHDRAKTDDYFKMHIWNNKLCIILRCIDKIKPGSNKQKESNAKTLDEMTECVGINKNTKDELGEHLNY